MGKCVVIVPAAGQGKRMNVDVNKQFLILQGMPIIVHTLRALEKSPVVDEIIPVIAEGEEEFYHREIFPVHKFEKISRLVIGGRERQESVFNGFQQIAGNCEIVLVHDGARPLISLELIVEAVAGAKENGAAIIAVPVKDTVKEVDSTGMVKRTLERKTLWQAQTPQAFRYAVLDEALQCARRTDFLGTDDASLVENIKGTVKIVPGSYENIKITTFEDLVIAEAILARREKA